MKKLIFLIVASTLAMTVPVFARYVQTMSARYETSEGRSKWYTVDVTFMAGPELNEATSSRNYGSYGSRYAVIFWGKSASGAAEASVIQLSKSPFCFDVFTQSCLTVIGNEKGEDQEGKEWEICTGAIC